MVAGVLDFCSGAYRSQDPGELEAKHERYSFGRVGMDNSIHRKALSSRFRSGRLFGNSGANGHG